MIKKIFLLLLFCLSTSSFVFAQISFQETIIDSTNAFGIGVYNVSTGDYSKNATISGDLDGDGDMDLLPKSIPLLWIENTNGLGNFSEHHLIDTQVERLNVIKLADFDGDQDLDILTAEVELSNGINVIAWYENIDGLGTFDDKQIVTTQIDNPSSLYITDIDNDGDLDVLSSSIGDGKIAWYENMNGQGVFGAQQIIATASIGGTTSYIEILASDLDGDSDNDVLFAANGSPDEVIYWLENTNAQGAFGSPQVVLDVFGGMYNINSADLDNDGDIDLYGDNTFDGVLYLKNDGLGNFTYEQNFPTSYDDYFGFSQAFDVDADNDLDIVAFVKNDNNTNEGAFIWFENTDSQGTFGTEQILREVNFIYNNFRFNHADFDGDGYQDIVCLNIDGYELSWNKNESGIGAFGVSQNIINDLRGLRDVLSADLDGDGDQDVVFASLDYDKIAWYDNMDGMANFEPQQIISATGNGYISIIAHDLDGDNDIDLIAASTLDDKIVWFENNGNGVFAMEQIITNTANGVRYVRSLDVDGDTDIDVVSIEEYGDKIVWYENIDGQGNFSVQQVVTETIDDILMFDFADINGDNDLDLIINEPLSWMANDGVGNYGAPQAISSTNDGVVKIADLDQDGDLDVVTSDPLGWHENIDGQGNFGEFQLIYDTIFARDFMLVVDIDGDEDMDVINVLNAGNDTNKIVYFKNYDGNFVGPETIAVTENGVSALFSEDLNEDGSIDILYTTQKFPGTSGKVAWCQNLGVLENQISGSVTFDIDNNGCDTSNIGVSNILVASFNGGASFSTFTQSDGSFLLNVNQGDLLTTLTPNLPAYHSFSPNFHTSSINDVNQSDDTAQFCVTPIGNINDLNVSIYPIDNPRPGFESVYQVVYNNIGTTTLNGTIEFSFDNVKMQFNSASESPSSQIGGLLVFSFTDLLPFESRSINIQLNVFAPPISNINDIVNTTVNVTPISNDYTPEDNVVSLSQTLVGSYDPNDITVLEGSQILLDQTDDYLHYVIRFQNTGTSEAVDVTVRNIIDTRLNWTTLQVESLSHNGRIEIADGIEASFVFENILLPSVNQNESESKGYIAYKIKPFQNVEVGEIFYNTASIFFDFNPTIITNTVSTEVIDELSVEDFETQDISIFPNPTTDVLTIKSNMPIQMLNIFDISGREIKTYNITKHTYTMELAIGDLSKGIYLLKVVSNEKTVVKKLIKN